MKRKRKTARTAGKRGSDFERTVKKDLESKGYTVVRSAGSRGPIDLVAMRYTVAPIRLLLIQCKIDGCLVGDERKALLSIEIKLGFPITAILAHRPARGEIEYVRLRDKWTYGV